MENFTKVYRKLNKLPVAWSSNIPKRYKRNAINGDLHRAKRIATDFDNEIVQIKEKFLAANFPLLYHFFVYIENILL